jgi:hypothetical protein
MDRYIVEYPDGTFGFLGILHPLDEEPDDGSGVAYDVGASAPPADMDTTGSSPEMGSQSATAPDNWVENPYVQLEGGFLAGLSLGFVPFGGVGQQLLDAGEVIPHGTPEARRGLAVGQIFGGIVSIVGGLTGKVLGGIATSTGIGAAIGLPAIAVSAGLVVGGVGNIAAGIRGLMTTGSGSGGSQGTPPVAGDTPRNWSAAREAYWKQHGPNGKAPTREVLVRDNKTGQVYRRTETKELHHVDPQRNNGSNEASNLREVWPTEHAAIDPHRHPGYEVLQVLE